MKITLIKNEYFSAILDTMMDSVVYTIRFYDSDEKFIDDISFKQDEPLNGCLEMLMRWNALAPSDLAYAMMQYFNENTIAFDINVYINPTLKEVLSFNMDYINRIGDHCLLVYKELE